jgi:hypothetical protein
MNYFALVVEHSERKRTEEKISIEILPFDVV